MLKRIKLMRYALGVGMLLTLAATSGAAYASWHPRDNSGAGTSLVSDLNLGGDLSLLTGTPARTIALSGLILLLLGAAALVATGGRRRTT